MVFRKKHQYRGFRKKAKQTRGKKELLAESFYIGFLIKTLIPVMSITI